MVLRSEILTNFDAASQTMGLHTSWSKTHLQNTGHGTAPQAVTIQGGHTVDVVERFTFLGSDLSSCSRSQPEMSRRIGLASRVTGQLTCVWRQSRLSLCTKLRLYNALCRIRPDGAETWTLTKSDEQKLEAFRMSCLRRILGIRWFDFVPNVSMMNQTQQRSVCSRIRDRRASIFGHVRRLPELAPAHAALRLVVNNRADHRPDDSPEWKRPRGRPRQTRIRQLEVDVGLSADVAWDMASDRQVWRAQ